VKKDESEIMRQLKALYPSLSLEELRRAGYTLRGYFEAIDKIVRERARGTPKDADLGREK
jgi:hypothetical protein